MENGATMAKYALLASVYDTLLGRLSRDRRVKNLAMLALKGGESVLLAGVGTGLDLPLLPIGVSVVGIDFSPAMLARARTKPAPPATSLKVMDAERLALPSSYFDAVILNLILAVAGNPREVLREALRVLKPGGRLLIWDKFSPSAKPGLFCRALNAGTSRLGTDITRNFAQMTEGLDLRIRRNEAGWLAGFYRVILAEKT